MDLTGIERVIAQLTTKLYEEMCKYDVIPTEIKDCTIAGHIIQRASIGQLLTLSNLGDRWKGLKLLGKDGEMINMQIGGCYGSMTLEGIIHK